MRKMFYINKWHLREITEGEARETSMKGVNICLGEIGGVKWKVRKDLSL